MLSLSCLRPISVHALAASTLPLLLITMAPAAAQDAVVVLSAAKSMRATLEGRSKYDIAREGLAWSLSRLPASARIGVVTYGDRSANDCRDANFSLPLAKPDPTNIMAGLNKALPKGAAPVGAALQLGASVLPLGKPGSLILIADSADTCKADPCAITAQLKAANKDLVIHVVTLGLKPADHPKLACIAERSGGSFRPVSTSAELLSALSSMTTAAAPILAVEVESPESVGAGSHQALPFRGPNAAGDWIGFVSKGSTGGSFITGAYAYTRDGSPGKMTAPSQPGTYEVRYVQQDNKVLFSKLVEVKAASATVKAPESSVASATVDVTFTGPDGVANFITIVPAASPDSLTWMATRAPTASSPAKPRTPGVAGEYEVRFILGAGAPFVAARQPLKVTSTSTARLAPASAAPGAQISVEIVEGPRVSGDYIYIARPTAPEADYAGGYTSVPRQGNAAIAAPREPGQWELRYVIPSGNSYAVIGRAALLVQ